NFFIKSKADFKKVDNAPDREPDYTSYRTFIAWKHEVWGVDEDENGEVIRVHFDEEDLDDEWGYDIVSYDVVDTFIGKYGDTGYKCQSNTPSSRYWYTDEGVYRESDHWGKCRNCYWTLDGDDEEEERVVGFCRWEDFDGGIEIDSAGFYRTRGGMKARVDYIREDDYVDFPVIGAVYLPVSDRWEKRVGLLTTTCFPEKSLISI